MSLHYIRDAQTPAATTNGSYDYSLMLAIPLLYHVLRCMGWTRLYEGMGYNNAYNYPADADMEEDGTTDWTAVGTATLAKDTTIKYQRNQSLKVTSNASGDGVESDTWDAPADTAATFYLKLRAYNDSGSSWDVQVDNGGGYASVGSIPDNSGVWTEYEFSYTRSATANNKFKVLDDNNTQGIIYLDDVQTYRQCFEHSAYENGTDGDVVNGDEFESSGYTFDSGDVGHFLCFYDPTNPENTGGYKITSINAGNAVLDLRVGGSETLTNTTSQDLVWRIYDPNLCPVFSNTSDEDYSAFHRSRVYLESPHSSKWRLGLQVYKTSYNVQTYGLIYGSPNDNVPYNRAGFPTYEGGPSTADFTYRYIHTPNSSNTRTPRVYAMIAGDGSFVSFGMRHNEISTYLYPYCVVGYFSDDTEYTEQERFAWLAPGSVAAENGTLDVEGGSSFGNGKICTDSDKVVDCSLAVLNTHSYIMNQDTDNRANPFSSEEWVVPVVVVRDPGGDDYKYGEIEMDRESGFFWTRDNMNQYSTFDSETYFHLCNGLVWPWNGFSVIA